MEFFITIQKYNFLIGGKITSQRINSNTIYIFFCDKKKKHTYIHKNMHILTFLKIMSFVLKELRIYMENVCICFYFEEIVITRCTFSRNLTWSLERDYNQIIY